MQASTLPSTVGTPPRRDDGDELAGQLLALWRSVVAGNGVGAYMRSSRSSISFSRRSRRSGDELTVKELAERLGLSLPGASRVDALVDRELIARREDTTDRRMRRLRCTDSARASLDRLDEARLCRPRDVVATLPAAHVRRLSGAPRPILVELPGRTVERP